MPRAKRPGVERLDLDQPFGRVTHITFRSMNPSYVPRIQTPNRRVTARTTTMTSFVRFSGLKAITICAALSMTAGLAYAGDNVSSDAIIHALQPKPLTRGLSAGAPQVDPAVKAKEVNFV